MAKIKQIINLIKTKKGIVFLKNSSVSDFGSVQFKVSAWMKGKFIGKMESGFIPGRYSHGNVMDTKVLDGYKKLGISKAMMKQTLKEADNLGVKFLRSNELRHPAQIKIRSKYTSKFIGQYMGKYSDETKVLSPKKALSVLNSSLKGSYSGTVAAVTKIPKNINDMPRITAQAKIRFLKIRGRIVPIRTKK